MLTPKLLLRLRPVALALLLTACGTSAGDIDSTPGPARFERVAVEGADMQPEAQCDDDGDGVFEPCLSQRQLDRLFNATIDALCEANDKLAWLSDYYLETQLEPSCEVPE